MGDFFDGGAKLNGLSQSDLLGEAAFGNLTTNEQEFVTSFNPPSLLFYFGPFAIILVLGWVYMILRCKEKTTPAMDTCAQWTGGILFLAFCAFIIFSVAYLIVGNRIQFRKDALEEKKQNLQEIVKFCDDHPLAASVIGVNKSISTCQYQRDLLQEILSNETLTTNVNSKQPDQNLTQIQQIDQQNNQPDFLPNTTQSFQSFSNQQIIPKAQIQQIDQFGNQLDFQPNTVQSFQSFSNQQIIPKAQIQQIDQFGNQLDFLPNTVQSFQSPQNRQIVPKAHKIPLSKFKQNNQNQKLSLKQLLEDQQKLIQQEKTNDFKFLG